MSPKHHRVIQVDLPCETVLDLAQQALDLIAARVDQVDLEERVVFAKGGLTGQPERADIQVSLEPQAEECSLIFHSQSPFRLFFSDLLVDWNNGRHFERMFRQVEALYRQEQTHPELIKPPPSMSLSAQLGACIVTNQGRFAQLRIEAVDHQGSSSSVHISFTTWEKMIEGKVK